MAATMAPIKPEQVGADYWYATLFCIETALIAIAYKIDANGSELVALVGGGLAFTHVAGATFLAAYALTPTDPYPPIVKSLEALQILVIGLASLRRRVHG